MRVNKTAPIALFVYNRLWHTKKTIEALQMNDLAKESELFIFADGPKANEKPEKVLQVREYLHKVSGFKKVTIKKRDENFGLANSIIYGVTEIVNSYGRVIVLEDDLVTSPVFLHYMNDALDLYKDNEDVISIHGYQYPLADTSNLEDTFFIKGADCWGWATWEDKWKLFEHNGKKILEELKSRKLQKVADFNNAYPYTKMLKNQIKGKNDSWAIRWYMSAFLRNKLTLYPKHSLVQNIGNDNSGTHGLPTRQFKIEKLSTELPRLEPVNNIKEDVEARRLMEIFFKATRANFIEKVLKKLELVTVNNTKIQKFKELIKSLLPPFFLNSIRSSNLFGIRFYGEYSSWEEAKNSTIGYSNKDILDKVSQAALKVKNGEFVFERDSVLFSEYDYLWPSLACLMHIAACSQGKLSVLDFGGSLGSSYFLNKKFLDGFNVEWSVVEQPHFVDFGKKEISDNRLRFYNSIHECCKERKPNSLFLSNVIHYLEEPYHWLDEFIDLDIDYILIDRTPFTKIHKEFIQIQKVPSSIYKASYPLHILDEQKIINIITESGFELIERFTPNVQIETNKFYTQGLFFKRPAS